MAPPHAVTPNGTQAPTLQKGRPHWGRQGLCPGRGRAPAALSAGERILSFSDTHTTRLNNPTVYRQRGVCATPRATRHLGGSGRAAPSPWPTRQLLNPRAPPPDTEKLRSSRTTRSAGNRRRRRGRWQLRGPGELQHSGKSSLSISAIPPRRATRRAGAGGGRRERGRTAWEGGLSRPCRYTASARFPGTVAHRHCTIAGNEAVGGTAESGETAAGNGLGRRTYHHHVGV